MSSYNDNTNNSHTTLGFDRSQGSVQLNQIAQNAKLTSLPFSKIKFEGLRESFELYRERCVPVLKGPIERTIARLDSEIVNLELYDDKALLFTFAYSRMGADRVLEYIGIAVHKVNNDLGHETFDYTVYTYRYEEPKAIEVPEPETEKQTIPSNPRIESTRKQETGKLTKISNFFGLDSSTKRKTEYDEINRETNLKRDQGSSHKMKRKITPEISLNDKMAALKVCFINELYNQRKLLLEEIGDGKYKVTNIVR